MSRLDDDMTGPEFLDNVAEAELHNGNEINARAFRARATAWRRDQREIEELRTQAAELRERLANVQSAILHGPRIRGAGRAPVRGATP